MPAAVRASVLLLLASCALPVRAQATRPDARAGRGKLQVYILAGQSNMEGHGMVPLTERTRSRLAKEGTFERDRRLYLDYLAKESEGKARFAHLLTADGEWASRDDVWFCWKRAGHPGGPLKCRLTVGLGAGGSRDRIGPELQFGHVMGDHHEEPVLLIKTAWGGKSLAVDFRPPSAGLPPEAVLRSRLERQNRRREERGQPLLSLEELKSTYGLYYRRMLEEVDDVLEHLESEFPWYDAGAGHEVAGLVWFQGWNDGESLEYADEYADNLVHLIRDVRRRYGPIPVVIGTSGFGKNAPSRHDGWVNRLRDHVEPAQIRAASRLDRVECFRTGDCLVPHPQRTSNGGIHHWFGSAEAYFLIGEGLGQTMRRLHGAPR